MTTDGPFKPKTADGSDDKPESQWTQDERRVVNQDQCLKSIIISCLIDDMMESVINCETAKVTWTDLVHSFEGPSYTKENKIMDLKLEYQTFRAKPSKSFSQTNTRYKTLLNELSNDGVTLSKHEINDFQENFDDKADERSSEEYLRDLDLEFPERSSQHAQSIQSKPKVQKDYKFEYKKMKAKLALIEAISNDEEETHVKVLMALANDELSVGKNHSRNGKWIDITKKKVNILLSMDEDSNWQTYLKYINIDLKDDLLVVRQAKLDVVTFQIQNTELTKLNHALQDQLKEERKLTESSSKIDVNPFILAFIGYDQEMVPKFKDWVERHNPNSKLPNFNTRRILVPESQAVNESLKLIEAISDLKSLIESGSEPQTPLSPLKNLHGSFSS
ncbi:hypothetical protein Tco_0303973 [Tanacetum coccineum]